MFFLPPPKPNKLIRKKLKVRARHITKRKVTSRPGIKTKKKPNTQAGGFCIPPFCSTIPDAKYKVLKDYFVTTVKTELSLGPLDKKTARLHEAIEYSAKMFVNAVYDKMPGSMRKSFKTKDDITGYIKEFIKICMTTHNSSSVHVMPYKYREINSNGYFYDVNRKEHNSIQDIKVRLNSNELTASNIATQLDTILNAERGNLVNYSTTSYAREYSDPEANFKKYINQLLFIKPGTATSSQQQNRVMFALSSDLLPGEACNSTSPNNCNEVVLFKTKRNPSVTDRDLKASDFAIFENKMGLVKYYYNNAGSANTSYKENIKKAIRVLIDKALIKGVYASVCSKYILYREFIKANPGINWTLDTSASR
jgi:hypothetical protein